MIFKINYLISFYYQLNYNFKMIHFKNQFQFFHLNYMSFYHYLIIIFNYFMINKLLLAPNLHFPINILNFNFK